MQDSTGYRDSYLTRSEDPDYADDMNSVIGELPEITPDEELKPYRRVFVTHITEQEDCPF